MIQKNGMPRRPARYSSYGWKARFTRIRSLLKATGGKSPEVVRDVYLPAAATGCGRRMTH